MRKLLTYSLYVMSFAFLAIACDEQFGISNDSGEYPYSGGEGTGGSLARFAIKGDKLYTVGTSDLKTFDITSPSDITQKQSMPLEWDVETIFPYQDYLFIGTTNGMHILDISNSDLPQHIGQYEHIQSCDPVVVSGNYAYVTLHSEGNWCGSITNELQIVDIAKVLANPQGNVQPEMRINMTNPLGLGVTDDYLFICDGALKVYDRTNPIKPELIKVFNVPDPYDVIPINGNLMLISPAGFFQYAYDKENISLLSYIPVNQNNNKQL